MVFNLAQTAGKSNEEQSGAGRKHKVPCLLCVTIRYKETGYFIYSPDTG